MSLEDRVADYIGQNNIPASIVLDDTFQDAAVKHVRMMSAVQLRKFATTKTVTGGTGLDVSGSIVIEVHKDGYPSLLFPPSWKGRLTDSNSLFEATTQSPGHYFEDNNVFVEPSGGQALVIDYPVIDADVDTEIPILPDDLEVATIIYVAMHVLNRDLQDEIADITTSITLPAAPTLTSYPAVPTITIAATTVTPTTISALPSPPVYNAPTKPTLTTNYSDLDTRITDDDVEVAGVILQEIQTQLTEYARDIDQAVAEFQANNADYQREADRILEQARVTLQEEIKQADTTLTEEVQQAQIDLSLYSAEVNSVTQENAALLRQYQIDTEAEIQRVQTEIRGTIAIVETEQRMITNLRYLYEQYLQPYMQNPNDTTADARIARGQFS